MVPAARQRRETHSGQVLSISVLVGVLAIALGTVTVVSLYLDRVSSTVESMARTEPVAGYEGRPEKALPREGSAAPVDYVVMVAGPDDTLLSVHLVRLSGSRQDLTMIGIPSDLLVPYDPGQPQQTLAEFYRQGDDAVVKQVELLFGVPTDHQIKVGLDGLSEVVEALGGVDGVPGAGKATDGGDLLRYVAAAGDGPGRVDRVSEVAQALIQRLGMVHAMTNPGQFDTVLKALENCTLVDSNLTVSEFESTLMESSVRADEIGSVTLATIVSGDGRMAVPSHLAKLRKAMGADTLAELAEPIAPSASPTPTR
ncbi:MAG: LCP family protein [Propionicimonas sp.]|nr:LCP family protein [Propionicimonas sp.]